jgi:hypothetical protein
MPTITARIMSLCLERVLLIILSTLPLRVSSLSADPSCTRSTSSPGNRYRALYSVTTVHDTCWSDAMRTPVNSTIGAEHAAAAERGRRLTASDACNSVSLCDCKSCTYNFHAPCNMDQHIA